MKKKRMGEIALLFVKYKFWKDRLNHSLIRSEIETAADSMRISEREVRKFTKILDRELVTDVIATYVVKEQNQQLHPRARMTTTKRR